MKACFIFDKTHTNLISVRKTLDNLERLMDECRKRAMVKVLPSIEKIEEVQSKVQKNISRKDLHSFTTAILTLDLLLAHGFREKRHEQGIEDTLREYLTQVPEGLVKDLHEYVYGPAQGRDGE